MSGVDAAVPHVEPKRYRNLLITFSSPVDPPRPHNVAVGQTLEFYFEPCKETSVVSAFARWGAEKCREFQVRGVGVVEIARLGYSIQQIEVLLPCKVLLVIDFDHYRKDLLDDLRAVIELLQRRAPRFEVILFARTSRVEGNPFVQKWQSPVMQLLSAQFPGCESCRLSEDVAVLSKETSRERREFEKKTAESEKKAKSKSKGGTHPWDRLYDACRKRLGG